MFNMRNVRQTRRKILAVAATLMAASTMNACSLPFFQSEPEADISSVTNPKVENVFSADARNDSNYTSYTYSESNTEDSSMNSSSSSSSTSSSDDGMAKEYPSAGVSSNVADGQFAANGVKITLGQTTLEELLTGSLDYARFYDTAYDWGNGKRVPKEEAASHLSPEKRSGRMFGEVDIIWNEDDSYGGTNWLELTYWNPDEDNSLELGKCVIIGAKANDNIFDDVSSDSAYYELPGSITSNDECDSMSEFLSAWGSVNAIPEDQGYDGYIFTRGKWWTWYGGQGAMLGVRVDDASAPTKAYGFEYTLPRGMLESSNGDYLYFVEYPGL